VSEFEVFLFCAAVGFASAGTIASFYQWVTSERADFSISRPSLAGWVVVVLISMFGGPFIVVQKVLAGLRSQEIRALPAVIGVVVAGMWSTCAGVFYLSLILGA
jgi:hypothetical protein